MSHGFLEFADFDGAWRYSSTPSIHTAQAKLITFSGHPTLVHIRAPASRSLALAKPAQGSIASRRRAQSDTSALTSSTDSTQAAAGAGAERPISAILVSFAPISWDAPAGPHPGSPADLPRNEDIEAVSPKSKVPGALKKAWWGRERESSLSFVGVPAKGRLGSSMEAVKSPYPPPEKQFVERVRRWARGVAGKFGRQD